MATLLEMGPNDPWSPSWRPDKSGARLRIIRIARRGAALAGLLFVPVAVVAAWSAGLRPDIALVAVVVGSAGVALLGAGLTPAALGSRIDAAVVGVAMAIAAPVAAVTSMLIAGAIVDAAATAIDDLPATILRSGVLTAVRIAPLVAIASGLWVIGVRWIGRRVPVEAPVSDPRSRRGEPGQSSRTLTSSPRRIRPGRSTSARTPKSACSPSRSPR